MTFMSTREFKSKKNIERVKWPNYLKENCHFKKGVLKSYFN